MKNIILLSLSCALWVVSAHAEPMRGPLPAEQQAHIRLMADRHAEIHRFVEPTEHGYRARTTSVGPEVAAALLAHVAYMKKRLDSGGRVRNWDPAFREFAAFHARMKTTVRELPDGLEIEVTGQDAEAGQVARNHARIVSGFAAEGRIAVQRNHSPILPADPVEAPAEAEPPQGEPAPQSSPHPTTAFP